MFAVLTASLLSYGWLVMRLIGFRVSIRGKKRYYHYNLAAWLLYCVLIVGASALLQFTKLGYQYIMGQIYNMLFLNVRGISFLANLAGKSIGLFYTALNYSAVYLCTVLVLPLFIKKNRRSAH